MLINHMSKLFGTTIGSFNYLYDLNGNQGGWASERRAPYGLKIPSGLLFYFCADNGVREPLAAQLPLQFWIGYEKVKKDDFFVADFRCVIPGFEQYSYYSTPESAILGIHALVHAIGAVARSF
jgi:hypothetical protein